MAKKIVHLAFPEKRIQDPVVYRLGHEFQVVTSIFGASVGGSEAWLLLELDGEEDEIRRSIEFLRSLEIQVEEKSESDI
jgi:ABC-type methionine transport system ATPase subunit